MRVRVRLLEALPHRGEALAAEVAEAAVLCAQDPLPNASHHLPFDLLHPLQALRRSSPGCCARLLEPLLRLTEQRVECLAVGTHATPDFGEKLLAKPAIAFRVAPLTIWLCQTHALLDDPEDGRRERVAIARVGVHRLGRGRTRGGR